MGDSFLKGPAVIFKEIFSAKECLMRHFTEVSLVPLLVQCVDELIGRINDKTWAAEFSAYRVTACSLQRCLGGF